MNPRLLDLWHQQHASGYPDVAGAHASITIPISDRLVTTLAVENLPPTAPVRELELRAHDSNRFTLRVRLTRPALMPPITVNLVIEQQPRLPESPFLILRLASSGGLMSLAASAMRFLNVLPPGIGMDGDRIIVNLRTLLNERGVGEVLGYLEHLEVMTEEGRFVIDVRGSVPPAFAKASAGKP
jgi:hypothetical protein